MVLDKTGTLTAGRFAIAAAWFYWAMRANECLALAAGLEASSRHPLARAFVHGAEEALRTEASVTCPGGRRGARRTAALRIGSEGFCRELAGPADASRSPEPGARRCSLADEDGWLAVFRLEDTLRPKSADVVEGLRRAGLRVHLLSGDHPAAVERRRGAPRHRGAPVGAATPQEKFAYVERLQREGRVVAMVGDGLNDAPVLARANVSFAMGAGTPIAQGTSDMILLSNRLEHLGVAFDTAGRTRRIIRENLVWAAAYNLVALPLAITGHVTPWMAGIGMSVSSLLVVMNALRLAGRPRDRGRADESARVATRPLRHGPRDGDPLPPRAAVRDAGLRDCGGVLVRAERAGSSTISRDPPTVF